MSNVHWIIIAIVVIAALVVVGFRHRFSIKWKFLGSELTVDGENNASDIDECEALRGESESVEATGERSVAIGGNVSGSTVITGDSNRSGSGASHRE